MNTTLKIAIAEYSALIRYGIESMLKRITEYRVQFIEITRHEDLPETLRSCSPDILIINPSFPGCFPAARLREEDGCARMKCVALIYSATNTPLLRFFDEQINIYDTLDEVKLKLDRMHLQETTDAPDDEEELQILSSREKEIVVCVVKGMTNREIADKLFLSTHTVITHRRNIARKLQIHSPSGLTIYAIVNKFVELSDIQSVSKS